MDLKWQWNCRSEHTLASCQTQLLQLFKGCHSCGPCLPWAHPIQGVLGPPRSPTPHFLRLLYSFGKMWSHGGGSMVWWRERGLQCLTELGSQTLDLGLEGINLRRHVTLVELILLYLNFSSVKWDMMVVCSGIREWTDTHKVPKLVSGHSRASVNVCGEEHTPPCRISSFWKTWKLFLPLILRCSCCVHLYHQGREYSSPTSHSPQGTLFPKGHLAKSSEIFGYHLWGGGTNGI